MAGRDTKLDADRQARILKGLAAGLTRACASARAGITDRTLRAWLARVRKGEEPFCSFSSALKKAEHDAEAVHVNIVRTAAQGGVRISRVTATDRRGRKVVTEKFTRPEWTAAAWWLERKFPESWSRDAELIRELLADHRRQTKRRRDG